MVTGWRASLVFALVICPAGASAQTLRDALPGCVMDRVTSLADSTETYAAYLPSSYDTLRTWPVAGILGAGASGIQFAHSPLGRARPPKPAYFGSFGIRDFNYYELLLFEPWLAEHDIAYRLRTFDGGHAWPRAGLAEEAFGWFELRAMRTGMRALDSVLVQTLFAHDTARARRLEEAGLWVAS